MAHINIINIPGAITGTQMLGSHELKAGIGCGSFETSGQIDAPHWVPTGSHELHETQGNGWTHQIVFGEHYRAGSFA